MKTPSEFQIAQLAHAIAPKVPPPQAPPPKNAAPPTPPSDLKAALAAVIKELEGKLVKLDALIKKRESAAHSGIPPRALANRERAAKEKAAPKAVAVQSRIDRENRVLRHASQADGSSGSKGKQTQSSKTPSLEELKALATRVRGQIAIAKQKLAAL